MTEQILLNRSLNVFSADTNAVVVEDKIQDEITAGNCYTIATVLDIGAGDTWVIFDSTGSVGELSNLVLLPTFYNATGGPCTISYYVNPTFSGGTERFPSNRNGNSSNSSSVMLYEDATVTEEGTRFSEYLIPASSLGAQTGGGTTNTILQAEFPPGLVLGAKITNATSPSVDVQVGFVGSWIEVA